MTDKTPAPASAPALCTLCGEPMPEGETMFFFHGYSGPCPKPALANPAAPQEETDVEGLLKVAADVSDHLRNWCGDDYAADVVDRLRTALRSTRAIADEKYAACEIIDAKRHEIANQRDALRCESDATIAGLRESFWNLKRALDSETDLRRAAYADRNAARSSLASLREQVAELSRYPLGHIEVVAVDSVLSLIDQAVARTIQKEEGRDGL